MSLPAYQATIDRIERLGARELRTSHWPVDLGRDPDRLVSRSRAFVERLELAVLDELRRGPRALPELWRRLEPRLGPYPALPVELARSIHSHLEAAEARGAVTGDGPDGAGRRWRLVGPR